MDLDDFLVELEHFKVVRNRKKVHGRRQLHGRMAPVAVLEDGELARGHELLQAVLDVAEVAGRCQMMMRADLLLDFRRLARIGGEGAHDVDPVKGVQLVEVHQVVLHVERRIHQVADDVGVLRDLDADGVFDRTDGRESVNAGADAADAFDERPGVAGVTALQNDLEAAPHGAGAHGIDDLAVLINLGLNAKMAFDTGDRIDHDATGVSSCRHYSPPRSLLFCLARAWLTALKAA